MQIQFLTINEIFEQLKPIQSGGQETYNSFGAAVAASSNFLNLAVASSKYVEFFAGSSQGRLTSKSKYVFSPVEKVVSGLDISEDGNVAAVSVLVSTEGETMTHEVHVLRRNPTTNVFELVNIISNTLASTPVTVQVNETGSMVVIGYRENALDGLYYLRQDCYEIPQGGTTYQFSRLLNIKSSISLALKSEFDSFFSFKEDLSITTNRLQFFYIRDGQQNVMHGGSVGFTPASQTLCFKSDQMVVFTQANQKSAISGYSVKISSQPEGDGQSLISSVDFANCQNSPILLEGNTTGNALFFYKFAENQIQKVIPPMQSGDAVLAELYQLPAEFQIGDYSPNNVMKRIKIKGDGTGCFIGSPNKAVGDGKVGETLIFNF